MRGVGLFLGLLFIFLISSQACKPKTESDDRIMTPEKPIKEQSQLKTRTTCREQMVKERRKLFK